jgi:hypothetical protein
MRFNVMAGLVPAIHVLLPESVDARDKRGHDVFRSDADGGDNGTSTARSLSPVGRGLG